MGASPRLLALTRNLLCFTVPDEEYLDAAILGWPLIFREVSHGSDMRRAVLVGAERTPACVHQQVNAAFKGVKLGDAAQDHPL
jgi:hypothetical protein